MVYRYILVTLVLISSSFARVDFDKIKTFNAKFTQKVTNEAKKTIEYTGEIFIKNSGKVLWNYKTPVIKSVYVVNDMVTIVEPELEQVITSNLDKSIDIVKLLSDAKKLEDNLYKSTLYDVDYFISLKEGKISSLSYKDQLGNKTKINFYDIKENDEIPDEMFIFFPPKDYDLIEK